MEPMIWLGVLAVLLIIEAATAGLATIWFAGGALVAAISAYCGAGITLQVVLFLTVSFVLLIFTRPIAVKYMNHNVEKTNADSLLGKRAVVIEKIDNLAQTGHVKIRDIEWMARTTDDSVTIPENAVVEIKQIHGVKLIVEEIKED